MDMMTLIFIKTSFQLLVVKNAGKLQTKTIDRYVLNILKDFKYKTVEQAGG